MNRKKRSFYNKKIFGFVPDWPKQEKNGVCPGRFHYLRISGEKSIKIAKKPPVPQYFDRLLYYINNILMLQICCGCFVKL